MPRGKRFCPYEDDYFEETAFKAIDGTLLHCVDPLHRATDGVWVRIVDDTKVVPSGGFEIPPVEEIAEE